MGRVRVGGVLEKVGVEVEMGREMARHGCSGWYLSVWYYGWHTRISRTALLGIHPVGGVQDMEDMAAEEGAETTTTILLRRTTHTPRSKVPARQAMRTGRRAPILHPEHRDSSSSSRDGAQDSGRARRLVLLEDIWRVIEVRRSRCRRCSSRRGRRLRVMLVRVIRRRGIRVLALGVRGGGEDLDTGVQ